MWSGFSTCSKLVKNHDCVMFSSLSKFFSYIDRPMSSSGRQSADMMMMISRQMSLMILFAYEVIMTVTNSKSLDKNSKHIIIWLTECNWIPERLLFWPSQYSYRVTRFSIARLGHKNSGIRKKTPVKLLFNFLFLTDFINASFITIFFLIWIALQIIHVSCYV